MINSIQEQTLYATVRIESTDSTGNIISLGTGFFLQRKLTDDTAKIYLVSNKHVLNAGTGFNLNFISKINGIPVHGKTITVQAPNIQGHIYGHHNSDVDVAAIDLTDLFREHANEFHFKTVNMDMLATFNEPELNISEEVVFVGFPDGRFDKANNLPLLRNGIISSHPLFDFNGLPQFVIDAQVFPGSSGSPVFVDLTFENFKNGRIAIGGPKNFKLLGIVSQTMIRNNQLQAVGTGLPFKTEEVLGLGIVFKATTIRELIDSLPTD